MFQNVSDPEFSSMLTVALPVQPEDRHRNPRYYNASRTRLGLAKDAPDRRSVEPSEGGQVVPRAALGGLLHRSYHYAAQQRAALASRPVPALPWYDFE